MADIVLTSKSFYKRNLFGQFTAALDRAATASIHEIAEVGRDGARAAAPEGPGRSDYGRRPKLKDNIDVVFLSSREGSWGVDAVNALSQETGAGAHEIHGNPDLVFYWEKAGVWFKGPMVNHPGNPPQPYLEAGLDRADAEAEAILAKHYGAV